MFDEVARRYLNELWHSSLLSFIQPLVSARSLSHILFPVWSTFASNFLNHNYLARVYLVCWRCFVRPCLAGRTEVKCAHNVPPWNPTAVSFYPCILPVHRCEPARGSSRRTAESSLPLSSSSVRRTQLFWFWLVVSRLSLPHQRSPTTPSFGSAFVVICIKGCEEETAVV